MADDIKDPKDTTKENDIQADTPEAEQDVDKNEVKTEDNVENIDTESESEALTTEKAILSKPNFNVGDRVVVNYKITEGEKERVQPYEGIVIGIKGKGISKTFTVRRMGTGNIGVERIFPMFSPNVESVNVKVRGKVRRAKLYYLRDRIGKAATKVKEKK